MIDLDAMRKELIRDEGWRNTAYADQFGNQTIGVGHKLHRSELPAGKWSDDKVSKALDADIAEALSDIQGEPWFAVCDTDARRRALVNMRFQLGGRGLRGFVHSLLYIQNQQWEKAGEHLRESLWYSQTPVRAERVIRQIEHG